MASGTITNLPASLKASVDTLNAQVGTVPSGKTVQGQIDSLNSNISTPENISVTLASTIAGDNLSVRRIGKVVVITGGVSSKTSDPVSFAHGESLITGGLPIAASDVSIVFMAMNYASGNDPRYQYRLKVADGKMSAFWDSVVVPKNGQPLYLTVCYISK